MGGAAAQQELATASKASVVSIKEIDTAKGTVSVTQAPQGPTDTTEPKKYDADEHLLSPEQVAEKYGTGIDMHTPSKSGGLASQEAAARLVKYGKNMLTPPKQVPEIIKFLKQFANPLMLLLLIAGALCFMAYALQPAGTKDKNNLILAAALIVVVSLTCTMSYIQERTANNVLASLGRMLPAAATVYRDGREMKVEAHQLVPGDVVRLAIGDRVPADVRIIESAELKVECSSLTGESDLVPAVVDKKSDQVEHARNIVFMSSLCMSGQGTGIVIRTGDNTYIGSIASLAGNTNATRSTLQAEVHRLVVFVAIIAFVTAIILFLIGVGRHNVSYIDAFINGFILVIVANVPEGLPATVTSLLTLTANRLKDRNVLIKRSDIIETLGCVSIIASDKTGTLTMNKMTVENLWVDCQLLLARTVQGPAPHGVSGGPSAHAVAVTVSGGAVARPSTDLARVTLNRASRRILDRVESRGQALGPSLAANSVALTAAATSSVNLGSPTHEQLAKSSVPPALGGIGRVSRSNRALQSTSVALIPQVKTSERHVLSRMSLGRTSTGFTASGRLKTTSVAGAAGGVTSSGPSGNLLTRPSRAAHMGLGVAPHPLAGDGLADFTQPGHITWDSSNSLTRLVTVATVCNKARFLVEEGATAPAAGLGEERQVAGDATDAGLLRYTDGLVGEAAVRQIYPPLFNIPFNSANKWSLVVSADPGRPDEQHVVMFKGAPEVVLNRCTRYYLGGEERPIDDDFRAAMSSAYERCGFMGERVLGFAYKVIPARSAAAYKKSDDDGDGKLEEELSTGLTLLGLISLVDPPKPSVPGAIAECRQAGIRIAMVTGDHPLTGEAIARKVGILSLKTQREVAAELGVPIEQVGWDHPDVGAVVVTGQQLSAIPPGDDAKWDELLDHEELVFARTTPQQKLQIVQHLQRREEVVAVTGDGVNDGPALARAQVGVAMGLGGSDVAREAADIILLDDEFASIVNAVEEGRVVFDNLRKTVAYTLTHALPELFPIFLNLALSFPLGLGGLLILSIDLVTEQGPAISLAYEHAESSVMARPPRDIKTERLIDGRLLRYSYLIAGVWQTLMCMIAFFAMFWYHGVSIPQVAFGLDHDHWLAKPEDMAPLVRNDGTILDGYAQQDIFREAQSAWYITLVLSQFWHIWLCKTRQVSIFKHGIFKNTTTIYGVIISIIVVLGIVYIPGLHGIFLTNSVNGIAWLLNLGFLAFMLPFTELCKMAVRRNPLGWVAKNLQW